MLGAPGRNHPQPVVGERVVVGVGTEVELHDLVVIGRNAARVRQKLFELDRGELRLEAGQHRTQHFADRRIPAELTFLDHHAGERRGHRLGIGAQVETVIERHGNVHPVDAHADGAAGDDLAVLHDRSGECREPVFGADRLQLIVERVFAECSSGKRQNGDHGKAEGNIPHGISKGSGLERY